MVKANKVKRIPGDSISEQLRKALLNRKESNYRIAVDSGVHHSVLSRFLNAKAGINMETVDSLATYLGVSLHTKS